MSNAIAVITIGTVQVPELATVEAVRKAGKALLTYVGESVYSVGKVEADSMYLHGVALAFLATADNQASPLARMKAKLGEKPNKAQALRLQHAINCTAAGQSMYKKGADSIHVLDVLNNDHVAAYSAAAIATVKAAAEDQRRLKEESAANEKRRAAIEAAAAAGINKAAEAAAAAAAAIHAESYKDAARHGATMDNHTAAAWLEAAEAAAAAAAVKAEAEAAAAAQKAAWLEEKAAAFCAEACTTKAAAAAAFEKIAEALGVKLTAGQKAAAAAAVKAEAEAAAAYAAEAEAKAAAIEAAWQAKKAKKAA